MGTKSHAKRTRRARRRNVGLLALVALVSAGLALALSARRSHPAGAAPGGPWVTAYYPGWEYDTLKPAEIDFSAITHLIHFSILPRADGTIDASGQELDQHSAETVAAAHAAGRKVLVTVGSSNSEQELLGAVSDANRAAFVGRLVAYARAHGYDGIDIDWEPFPPADKGPFEALARDLRAAIDAQMPGGLLTTAPLYDTWDNVKDVAALFDQINLQTYVMSGPYEGWVTWHNSPLHSGGRAFSNGRPLPSAEGAVNGFLAAGVPRQKLGIGVKFGGALWTGGTGTPTGGVTAPLQGWATPPTVDDDVAYSTIMDRYYAPDRYHFDDVALVPYLSVDNPGPAGDLFLSYEDDTSIRAKFDFLRAQQLGGFMIWELALDHRPNQPAGQRDPLLQAVKTARAADFG